MKKPNILWICTDQQRSDTIGALGNEAIHTPNLDRLVGEGVAFTNNYCQSPICTPSRASFMTGLYPSAVKCSRNGNDHWAEAAPVVTKLLKDAGYFCGLAGKLHLAGAAGRVEPRPRDDGFQVFHWSHSARDVWKEGHDYAEWVKSQGENLGELRERLGYIPAELHQTKWCADRSIDFIKENRPEPWLFAVNIFDPHKPFDPPPEYLERYQGRDLPGPHFRKSDLEAQARLAGVDFQTACQDPESFGIRDIIARYYAMVELVDEHVGRMLQALEDAGQRENTLVIFTSDHGEMLGDHGLLKKGCRFYEGLAKVPLILSWPGVIPGGRNVDSLVELRDLAPTLLELAGVEQPENMTGHSLWPCLHRREPHPRTYARCEYYRALNANVDEWDHLPGSYGTMYRRGQYKLVVYHGYPMGELFDLEKDPHEYQNLWDVPEHQQLKLELILESFDASARAVDLGPPQTCHY